jgi:hypothetical protein
MLILMKCKCKCGSKHLGCYIMGYTRQVRSRAPTEKILENTKQIAHSSLSLWRNKTYSSKGSGATVGHQQNRVPHSHRKTTHQDKYYGPWPITAGPDLTPPKTKAKGQAPEPPSAPSLCLTPFRPI